MSDSISTEKNALVMAINAGCSVAFDMLLEVPGIDLELTDSKGHTALICAVCKNNPVVVLKLIQKGVNLDHLTMRGGNALIYCLGRSSDTHV